MRTVQAWPRCWTTSGALSGVQLVCGAEGPGRLALHFCASPHPVWRIDQQKEGPAVRLLEECAESKSTRVRAETVWRGVTLGIQDGACRKGSWAGCSAIAVWRCQPGRPPNSCRRDCLAAGVQFSIAAAATAREGVNGRPRSGVDHDKVRHALTHGPMRWSAATGW